MRKWYKYSGTNDAKQQQALLFFLNPGTLKHVDKHPLFSSKPNCFQGTKCSTDWRASRFSREDIKSLCSVTYVLQKTWQRKSMLAISICLGDMTHLSSWCRLLGDENKMWFSQLQRAQSQAEKITNQKGPKPSNKAVQDWFLSGFVRGPQDSLYPTDCISLSLATEKPNGKADDRRSDNLKSR